MSDAQVALTVKVTETYAVSVPLSVLMGANLPYGFTDATEREILAAINGEDGCNDNLTDAIAEWAEGNYSGNYGDCEEEEIDVTDITQES